MSDFQGSLLPERAAGYLFPLLLLAIEWTLRDVLKLNAKEFMGPTLAAVGVGLVIPLTSYRDAKVVEALPDGVKKAIRELKVQAESDSSRRFRAASSVVLLALTICWLGALYLGIRYPDWELYAFPVHYYVGIAGLFIGIIMSEVKEML